MKRRYVGLIVAEAIIIILLLIGVAVLFVLLYRPASMPSLPGMPTYDAIFSTTIPLSTASTVLSTNTPAAPAQTALPVFILNGTPIYPTPVYIDPTRIPPATPLPLSVTVWTITPTSNAAVPVSKTCRNILYPMAAGGQWVYQANALNRADILSMSVLSVNNSQGSVLVNNQSTGSTKQAQVQCDGDVIRSFPFMSADVFLGSFANSSLAASYVSGVLAPNEAAFLNSNWALSWSSQYLVSGNTTINRNGRQFNVSMNNSPITLTCQTLAAGEAAFETVTVAAGTFRALKVVCTEQGQVTANVNGVQVSGLADGRSNQWFAPNIGLVKMRVEFATVTILGVSFSVLTDNSFELKSYQPAP